MADEALSNAEGALVRLRQLYRGGRWAEAAAQAARAVADFPDSPDLWNLHGVMLRRQGRAAEALDALETALRLSPGHAGARLNRGNVLVDLGRAAEALDDLEALAAADPESPAALLAVGRARARAGRPAAAEAALRAALDRQPRIAEAWIELARAVADQAGPAAGAAVLAAPIADGVATSALLEAKALLLNAAGAHAEKEAFLRQVLAEQPDLAWAQFYLGDVLAARDDPACETHLRRAIELAPHAPAPRLALIQRLTLQPAGEDGPRLDAAHALALPLLDGRLGPYHTKILIQVLTRVCDFAGEAKLGDLASLARSWVDAGLHTALLQLLSRVTGQDDRLELLAQHRRWGAARVEEAARAPIRRPPARSPPRSPGGRLRVGLLSSDLRNHPVGFFAEPLFDHRDPARVELVCYSFDPRPADAFQVRFAAQANGFRNLAGASDREAAQAIADDGLDVLLDLGGSTGHNRPEPLAWRPAPVQASWLGYVHSLGLPTIDGLICDRFTRPADDALLVEAPWVLPGAYYPLGDSTFDERAAIDPLTPEERRGAFAFGTASNPTKFTAPMLRVWAEITAAAPGARFTLVRREAGSAVFRAKVAAAFAAAGLPPERLDFHVPGPEHLPLYNLIDVSLDTFPLTGGTTTVESLWMGAPVVSLRGPALYERLSWSVLGHLGLGDLVSDDLAGYRAAALELAADRERRRELRATLRPRMRASAMGDGAGFARGFYDLLAAKAG